MTCRSEVEVLREALQIIARHSIAKDKLIQEMAFTISHLVGPDIVVDQYKEAMNKLGIEDATDGFLN